MAALPKPLSKKSAATSEQKKVPLSRKSKVPKKTKTAPRYLQAKLAVSRPGDSSEQEADKVAAQVARSPRVTAPRQNSDRKIQTASLEPGITPQKDETLSPKPVPAAEHIQRLSEQQLQSRGDANEEVMHPKAIDGGMEEVQRQSDEKEEETLQTKSKQNVGEQGQIEPGIEERIHALRGGGDSLGQSVLDDMNQHFGHDFGNVRVHTGAEAADLCAQTRARAFTVGNDIFFAPGEYAPDTNKGRELLAHELTHVVQQNSGMARMLMRANTTSTGTGSGNSGAGATPVFAVTGALQIPTIKARHAPRYQTMARARTLRRAKGPNPPRNTIQRSLWMQNVTPNLSRIPADQRPNAASGYRVRLNTSAGVKNIPETGNNADESALLDLLKIPTWDRSGRTNINYQVDHIIEHQLGGHDELNNMELLDQAHNGAVGGGFRGAINDAIRATLDGLPVNDPSLLKLPDDSSSGAGTATSKPTYSWIKNNRITEFRSVEGTGGRSSRSSARQEGNSAFWSKTEIESLDHVVPLLDESRSARSGSATQLSILSPTGGLLITKLGHGRNDLNFEVRGNQRYALSGFKMLRVQMQQGYNSPATPGTQVGTLITEIHLSDNVNTADYYEIPLLDAEDIDYAVKIGDISALNNVQVDVPGASPVDLNNFAINRGLSASAILRPTHPLLQGLQIPGQVVNGRLGIFYTLDATAAVQRLPIPGLEITASSVILGFDGERLSTGGDLEFAVRNFGQGYLAAELDSDGNFGLEGRFNADSELFDRSELRMWYRSATGIGSEGTLAIDSAEKIKGIRSASIRVRYENSTFAAEGEVAPNIPGIEEAGLTIRYGEEEGLTIGGNLALAANPAIRSGSIDVTVNKRENEWRVAATGTAQPAIPGINSQLAVNYDNGAFGAEFSGQFQRGMLSGQVTVGATNRTLAEDGTPTGEPSPDSPIIVYGSGSSTIRLAPWLEGSAGITFAPNGEVTMRGEIGLPDQLEIFRRLEINKRLLDVSTQIPIIPGIVAEVGGNLTATAGIGPGALDQLRIGIEYNPAQEQNTHVTGDAHLNIPADAGLRLGARAGIGLGITGASATGGLEIGGTMGVQGAAEAGVHIDWMPSRGLQIDAEGYLHAEPRFRFDVGGYVSVRTLGFSLYDNRWELAAYELGSNLRLGLRFPIRYREGQPFNISLNDVQFEVPDVNPGALIRELGQRIV